MYSEEQARDAILLSLLVILSVCVCGRVEMSILDDSGTGLGCSPVQQGRLRPLVRRVEERSHREERIGRGASRKRELNSSQK